jgi:hypothetical protein
MRQILSILTSDQHKTLSGKNQTIFFFIILFLSANQDDYRRPRRAFTSPSTSILLPSSLNQSLNDSNPNTNFSKTENDWNHMLAQV